MTIAADIGKRPVTESLPAGAEVRDSVQFEQVQNEIAKLTSLSGACTVNWGSLVPLCETIITRQGKDLLIACYLAGSLLETEGAAGLASGLGIVADMLQTYWEGLFPSLKRMRARRNALEWLAERISQKTAEASWQGQAVDGPVLDAILLALRRIDATLTEKDNEAPSMRPLLALFGALPRIDSAAPAAPALESAPPAPRGPSSVSVSPPASPPSPLTLPVLAPPLAALDNNLAAEKALALLGERVGELAQWYQGIDLENPVSYRLKRIALWSAIDAAPPDHNGKTLVPGPPAPTVEILKRLDAGGSPQEIIRFCENQLAIEPFWLDINRLAAKALALSGAPFAQAMAAVESETARFVERLPRLAGLTFSNGQAFADAATRNWLDALPVATGRSRAAPGAPEAPDNLAGQAIAEARTLAAAGKRGEAAARLQQEIALADSARKRFNLRLRLCEILVAQGAQDKFAPFARILLADIDRFRLDDWEPRLAVDGLIVAYHLLRPEADCKSEIEAILARMARLDPAAALRLLGE